MIGIKTLIDAVAVDTSLPGVLILVPRGRSGPVRSVTLPQSSFVVHFANAFDVDPTTLAVDLCSFDRFTLGHEFGFQGAKRPLDPALPDVGPPQRLYRAIVRDDSDTATWRSLSDCGLDFPRVHPEREGVEAPAIYASTRADRSKSDPFDSIARIDARDPERPTEVWSADEHQFVGEPVFAPHPGATDLDDGFVIALVSDGLAARTDVCIFEAKNVAKGPIASVALPLQPYGFHGAWEAAS
jgi:carotenoid cleavage dioxygenase-like enzyme